MHALISSANGFLFFGVMCLTMFVMKSSSRFIPFSVRVLVRSCPALPTNGRPVLSSSFPGFCPTSIIVAFCGPSPGTAFNAPCQRRHFLQLHICLFSLSNDKRRFTFVVEV